MSGFENFLWGIAPYISFTILIVGTIIRRVFFARTWTAKSSEFLDKGGERLFTPSSTWRSCSYCSAISAACWCPRHWSTT